MTAPKLRVLTHPRSDLKIEVERDHLDGYLAQGWVEQTLKTPTPKSADRAPEKDARA